MAKVKLVGVQPLDFDTNDGGHIKGINLHVNYDDDNVYGQKADTKFLSDALCTTKKITVDSLLPYCGSEIDVDLNLKGKVTGITPVT